MVQQDSAYLAGVTCEMRDRAARPQHAEQSLLHCDQNMTASIEGKIPTVQSKILICMYQGLGQDPHQRRRLLAGCVEFTGIASETVFWLTLVDRYTFLRNVSPSYRKRKKSEGSRQL
jgi:hypothetical protein